MDLCTEIMDSFLLFNKINRLDKELDDRVKVSSAWIKSLSWSGLLINLGK